MEVVCGVRLCFVIAECLINPDFVSHKSSVKLSFPGSSGLNPRLGGDGLISHFLLIT